MTKPCSSNIAKAASCQNGVSSHDTLYCSTSKDVGGGAKGALATAAAWGSSRSGSTSDKPRGSGLGGGALPPNKATKNSVRWKAAPKYSWCDLFFLDPAAMSCCSGSTMMRTLTSGRPSCRCRAVSAPRTAAASSHRLCWSLLACVASIHGAPSCWLRRRVKSANFSTTPSLRFVGKSSRSGWPWPCTPPRPTPVTCGIRPVASSSQHAYAPAEKPKRPTRSTSTPGRPTRAWAQAATRFAASGRNSPAIHPQWPSSSMNHHRPGWRFGATTMKGSGAAAAHSWYFPRIA
mmetsp:Transcript_51673/g.156997  ORF Transcript_51673/g.156997 Transcript_51673/m.156997 type:complete len:290 (+) Transcript_51673:155-1024(+)